MEGPFFSIIIPAYNAAAFLPRAVQSIVKQAFTSWELLVIDGNSVDDTAGVMQGFTSGHANIQFASEPDKGTYDAMNKGIKKATGRFIYFLGADDELYNEQVLQRVYDCAKMNPESRCIYGDVEIQGDTGWATDKQRYDGPFDLVKLLSRNINHQAIFYSKDLLQDAGGLNIDYTICSDWDLNLHAFALTKPVYCNLIVAKFYAGGISSNIARRTDAFLLGDMVHNTVKYFGVNYFFKGFTPQKHLFSAFARQAKKEKRYLRWAYCRFVYRYHTKRSQRQTN